MENTARQLESKIIPFRVLGNTKEPPKYKKDGTVKRSGGRQYEGSSLVYPIKDLAELEKFIRVFKEEAEDVTKKEYESFIAARNFLLIMIGLNSAYRISDIISLKWKDVFDSNGDFREVQIHEKKTGKYRSFYLNDVVKTAITNYLRNENVQSYMKKATGRIQPKLHDYIFFTRKSEKEHINSNTARMFIKEAADKVGINMNVGTHTLRKTFVYHTLKKNPTALNTLMECLNHSSQAMTLKYATITGEEINQLYDGIGELYSGMIGG